MSFAFAPGDTPEQLRTKLYLGVISVEEQCYSLGAAIAELRKQLEQIDRTVAELKTGYAKLKEIPSRPFRDT